MKLKENNLESLITRANQLRSDLLHGGYNGEFLEMEVFSALFDEMLDNFDYTDRNEVKKILSHVYFLGQINIFK